MTLPSLSLLGKIPVLSHWFIIKVKGLVNNFNEIASYPELDFEFNPRINNLVCISVSSNLN